MADIVIQGAFGPVNFTPAVEKPTLTAVDIESLDEYLDANGMTLPDAYRQFLLTNNGGKVSPNGFAYRYDAAGKELLAQVLDPEDEILTESGNTLRYFHGFGPGPITNLIDFQSRVIDWGRPGLFGIASASYGDVVVLDLAPGPDVGSVHYLTLQGVAPLVEEGEQVPLGFIAPNFQAFQTGFFDFDEVMAASQSERLQDFLDKTLRPNQQN
ncbi:SMI1/KNR4 family protein [Yoonia sp. 2307UL14-13]|uniref:SMI1/KNR4 family protein n=1 Tax=Yoonia sp. 2307UL14-13 TaxID=3126506 RepID=UPI0030A9410F